MRLLEVTKEILVLDSAFVVIQNCRSAMAKLEGKLVQLQGGVDDEQFTDLVDDGVAEASDAVAIALAALDTELDINQ